MMRNRTIKRLVALGIAIFLSNVATADKLTLPEGMGGVPDIGDIPCNVFNKMLVVGPLGTRHSLLTWADGYYYAKTGKTIDEILELAAKTGESWDFYRLTDHLADYCAQNPDDFTREAVSDLEAVLISP